MVLQDFVPGYLNGNHLPLMMKSNNWFVLQHWLLIIIKQITGVIMNVKNLLSVENIFLIFMLNLLRASLKSTFPDAVV